MIIAHSPVFICVFATTDEGLIKPKSYFIAPDSAIVLCPFPAAKELSTPRRCTQVWYAAILIFAKRITIRKMWKFGKSWGGGGVRFSVFMRKWGPMMRKFQKCHVLAAKVMGRWANDEHIVGEIWGKWREMGGKWRQKHLLVGGQFATNACFVPELPLLLFLVGHGMVQTFEGVHYIPIKFTRDKDGIGFLLGDG